MKPKEFFDRVSLMRAKQKEYFKTRNKASLEARLSKGRLMQRLRG